MGGALEALLARWSLLQYRDLLVREEITDEHTLMLLEEEDLDDLGITTVGTRRKFLALSKAIAAGESRHQYYSRKRLLSTSNEQRQVWLKSETGAIAFGPTADVCIARAPEGGALKVEGSLLVEGDLLLATGSADDANVGADVSALQAAVAAAQQQNAGRQAAAAAREAGSSRWARRAAQPWELIAHMPGSTKKEPFWADACAAFGDMVITPEDATIRVTMGQVQDYFKPRKAMTLCEFIRSKGSYLWSPWELAVGTRESHADHTVSEVFHEDFRAVAFHYSGYGRLHYGGSAVRSSDSWAYDGRSRVSFWGDANPEGTGGCCFTTSHNYGGTGTLDDSSWGRALDMHIKRHDENEGWTLIGNIQHGANVLPMEFWAHQCAAFGDVAVTPEDTVRVKMTGTKVRDFFAPVANTTLCAFLEPFPRAWGQPFAVHLKKRSPLPAPRVGTWELVTATDGSVTMDALFWNKECAEFDRDPIVTVDHVVRVASVDGQSVDYFKPTEAMHLCQLLKGGTVSIAPKFAWSATEDGAYAVPAGHGAAANNCGDEAKWERWKTDCEYNLCGGSGNEKTQGGADTFDCHGADASDYGKTLEQCQAACAKQQAPTPADGRWKCALAKYRAGENQRCILAPIEGCTGTSVQDDSYGHPVYTMACGPMYTRHRALVLHIKRGGS